MEFNKPSTWKDWSVLLTAWLSIALLGIKSIFNIDLTNWVGDIVNFVLLTIFIVISGIGVWKNTYVSKKAQEQKELLEKEGLK